MEAAAQNENQNPAIEDVHGDYPDALCGFAEASRKAYRLAFRILRNHEDTEDVVQTAMLKAYSKLSQFRGDAQFDTWLVRIALNEALMNLRKRRTERVFVVHESSLPVRVQMEDATQNPEEHLLTTELLTDALTDLGSSLGTAFLLHNVEGLTIREIARALRISVSAAKSRVFRARARARRRAAMLLRSPRSTVQL
jgi:RNA polymerase sigma-70 factor, ECF subfamily